MAIRRSQTRAGMVILHWWRKHWRGSATAPDLITGAPPHPPLFAYVHDNGLVKCFGAQALANRVLMFPEFIRRADVLRLGRLVKKDILAAIQTPPANAVDPITLEPPAAPVFRHTAENGIVTHFDALNLCAYFRSEGKFLNPLTGTPFHAEEVACVGYLAGDPQLCVDMHALEVVHAAERDRQAVVQWMQSEVGAAVENVLAERANVTVSFDSITRIFSRVRYEHVPAIYNRIAEVLAVTTDEDAVDTLNQLLTTTLTPEVAAESEAPWLFELCRCALQAWMDNYSRLEAMQDFLASAAQIYYLLSLSSNMMDVQNDD